MSNLNRRVYVYKTLAEYYEQKEGSDSVKPYPADMQAVFTYIQQELPFNKNVTPNAYDGIGESVTAIKIFRADRSYVWGHLANIRYNALSQIERFGELQFLTLPEDAGQYDPAHFVYFPEDHILMLEANRNAPQMASMGRYLEDKLRNHDSIKLDSVRFVPRIRADALERFLSMSSLGSIELEVYRDKIAELRETDEDFADYVTGISRFVPDSGIVTIGYRQELFSRSGMQEQETKSWLAKLVENSGDIFHKAKVYVRPDQTDQITQDSKSRNRLEPVDLLSDKFVFAISSPRIVNRTIDSAYMFDQITSAYTNNIRGAIFGKEAKQT